MRLKPEHWKFECHSDGGLLMGGVGADDLARRFGTPLHVIDEPVLRGRVRRFLQAFRSAYPGPAAVHYAFKANNAPGVVRILYEEGLEPEVGTPHERRLALELGWTPEQIIVNGPNKGALLGDVVADGAGLIVVDGFEELRVLDSLTAEADCDVDILLRVNPDCVPRGMNRASATGSRRASVFGFDIVSGEVAEALSFVAARPRLRFQGLHVHAGTGIRRPEDYREPLRRVLACAKEALRLGLATRILDVGGGFGVPTSREFSTPEFLMYQGMGRLPAAPDPCAFPGDEAFAEAVCGTIVEACRRHGLPLPTLVLEPGRTLVSGAGVLLVTVGSVKERPGAGTWVITDGGAGTVAFPLFYEYHEVFLARSPEAPRNCRYHLVGSACHAADWIYRNKQMPELKPGDVLAICDAGAYFTVQECNFGFSRPAIVATADGQVRVLRRRETFADLVARDLNWKEEPCRASA
jgi:diaminopimelate decarboxylase